MRVPLLAALLGTTALLTPATAQQQVQPLQPGQQAAGVNACPTLFQVVQQRGPAQTGVTFEQIQTWSSNRNEAACRQQLQRLGIAQAQPDQQVLRQGATAQVQPGQPPQGANLLVQAQPPQIVYDQPTPRVQVTQPQPQVTVRQPQPQIAVRMPAPTITVQQPQPEIVVRMPQPEVNVAQAQPQVSVQIPPPQVRFAPSDQQPQVQVQPSRPEVVVQPTQPVQPTIQQAGAPSVQYQQVGEPRIIYQQAQGQPVIRYEQIGPQQQQGAAAQQQTQRAQTATAATPADTATTGVGTGAVGTGTTGLGTAGLGGQTISASELLAYTLYDPAGERLGDVERVVIGADNQPALVVGHGGFLGLGERRVLVPLNQVRLVGDRLVASGITQQQMERMAEWRDTGGYRQLTGDQTVTLVR